jgi:hypothetical protein
MRAVEPLGTIATAPLAHRGWWPRQRWSLAAKFQNRAARRGNRLNHGCGCLADPNQQLRQIALRGELADNLTALCEFGHVGRGALRTRAALPELMSHGQHASRVEVALMPRQRLA